MRIIPAVIAGLSILFTASSVNATTIKNLTELTGVPGYSDYRDKKGWHGAGVDDIDNQTDDITFFYLFQEETTNAGINSFGIYNFTINPDETVTTGTSLEIFNGSASATSTNLFGQITSTSTTISFDRVLGTATNSTSNVTVALDPVFGFYLDTGNGDVLYSHNVLNTNEEDSLLMFDVSDNVIQGLLGSNLLLAWEDGKGLDGGTGQSLRDFNDMVIGISDVHGVPTPATLALMGLGLLTMRAVRKRKIG